MTAVADRVEAHLPAGPRKGRPRVRPLVAALAVVVLLFAGVLGVEAARLRAAVDRERTVLRNARTVEAAARRTLAGVRAETKTIGTEHEQTFAADRVRSTQRLQAHEALLRLEQQIALVKQLLSSTEAAQTQLALYSAPRHSCITGIRTATTALQRGDPSAALVALTNANDACSAALAAATGARYPFDFPDPSVLEVDSVFYAYSTNSGTGNIQVLVSRDLVKWVIAGDALAGLPVWASPGATWAPAVVARGSTFVAYYTTREITTGRQCISVAVAASPVGPFVDASTAPLICQLAGSIDPSPFVDEHGDPWLLWKSEATATGPPTIWSQPTSEDGLTLAGAPRAVLTPGQSWEHGVVEGPSMTRIGGHDYLFYSGGDWTTAAYAQGIASCDGPAGPCHRILSAPVLESAGPIAGPGGGAAFTTADGAVWLAFHAFTQPAVGYPNSRTFHLATVRVVHGIPVVTPD